MPIDEAERLAWSLRAALPEADPLSLDGATLDRAVREAGADPAADELVAAALVAWESLLN